MIVRIHMNELLEKFPNDEQRSGAPQWCSIHVDREGSSSVLKQDKWIRVVSHPMALLQPFRLCAPLFPLVFDSFMVLWKKFVTVPMELSSLPNAFKSNVHLYRMADWPLRAPYFRR